MYSPLVRQSYEAAPLVRQSYEAAPLVRQSYEAGGHGACCDGPQSLHLLSGRPHVDRVMKVLKGSRRVLALSMIIRMSAEARALCSRPSSRDPGQAQSGVAKTERDGAVDGRGEDTRSSSQLRRVAWRRSVVAPARRVTRAVYEPARLAVADPLSDQLHIPLLLLSLNPPAGVRLRSRIATSTAALVLQRQLESAPSFSHTRDLDTEAIQTGKIMLQQVAAASLCLGAVDHCRDC
jgi:hypothetical protein